MHPFSSQPPSKPPQHGVAADDCSLLSAARWQQPRVWQQLAGSDSTVARSEQHPHGGCQVAGNTKPAAVSKTMAIWGVNCGIEDRMRERYRDAIGNARLPIIVQCGSPHGKSGWLVNRHKPGIFRRFPGAIFAGKVRWRRRWASCRSCLLAKRRRRPSAGERLVRFASEVRPRPRRLPPTQPAGPCSSNNGRPFVS